MVPYETAAIGALAVVVLAIIVITAKRAWFYVYYYTSKAAANKTHVFVVDGALFAIGIYFPIKDVQGFSVSEFITDNFSLGLGIWVKFLGVGVVFYSALAKLFLMLNKRFPVFVAETRELESINECVLKINSEIRRHMGIVRDEPAAIKTSFLHQHHFEENIALVTENLGEHLKESFPKLKLGDHDIFVSIYKASGFENVTWNPHILEYVTHWHPKRQDVVSSMRIDTGAPAFSGYECVKAIMGRRDVSVKWDCSDYEKTRSHRGDSIQHYVGFRLESNGETIGFITIEFHNHIYFPSEKEMKDFVERDVIAFRYLIEYQFLKKKFFTALHPHLR